MRVFIVTLFMLFVSASAHAQDEATTTSEFNGSWQNEAGSLVTLPVNAGEVRGTYQTNVGQPDKNQSFALIGFVEGDQEKDDIWQSIITGASNFAAVD